MNRSHARALLFSRHAKSLVNGLGRAGKPHELTVRIVPDAKSPQR
jgi:hypothetical protein